MKSCLADRIQCVRVRGETSPFLSNEMGSPQGSNFGPLLFSLFINDLPSVCTECEVQMYADDTVIYIHAKTKELAAVKLNAAMVNVNNWLSESQLCLNMKKTVCMYFTKSNSTSDNPGVFVAGEPIQVVSQFKCLGIILDSTLSFKKQVKRVTQTAKYNLSNFRFMRNCLTSTVALHYMNAMIISHLMYCMTIWTHAKSTTMKPILSLYKQALKVLDRKPHTYHHCHILSKYRILSWENLTKYTDACLLFKVLNGKARPPLSTFVKQKTSRNRSTRSTQRGDCTVPFRSSSFSQSCFAVRATQF